MIQVWNYGGGVQSCAIAVLILQGRLPAPDFAVIADTGREKGSTWEYLDNVVAPALGAMGIKIHRPHKDQYAYAHQDLWSKSGESSLSFLRSQLKITGFRSCLGIVPSGGKKKWSTTT